MKTGKPLFIFVMSVLMIAGLVIGVSSLDAKIGNGKMILREDVGNTIDKSIRVINTNKFPVRIEVSKSGELADSIEIIDETFIIPAGSDKNPIEKFAKFKINVRKVGEQRGTINIKFMPDNIEDGKNGVALASTIILIGLGESDLPDDLKDPKDPKDTKDPKDPGEIFKFNPAYYLLIVTVVIFLMLVFVIVMYSKNNKNIDQSVDKKIEEKIIKPKKRVVKK